MSTTGLAVFDTTLRESNAWLKSIMLKLETDDRQVAWRALRATLHALRDRIGPENAVHLGAQLPMLLRGAYYEGWRPSATPTRERHVRDFLDHVGDELPSVMTGDADLCVRAVMETLWERIDADEMAKVGRMLPGEFRALWAPEVSGA